MAGEAQLGSALGGALGSIWGPAGASIGGSLGGALGGVAAAPGSGGPDGPDFHDATSATYGTSLGNDGWSINFGGGTQIATPTSSQTGSYPTTQRNPLSDLAQQQPQAMQAAGFGGSSSTLILCAVGLLVAIKLLRK